MQSQHCRRLCDQDLGITSSTSFVSVQGLDLIGTRFQAHHQSLHNYMLALPCNAIWTRGASTYFKLDLPSYQYWE